MNNFGSVVIVFSLGVLIFALIQTIYGIVKQNEKAIELGRVSLMANFGVILLAFLVLVTQLARMDLTNYYAVMHSSENLDLFYRVTSIWAGSSGSLLFWNLLLNLFTFIVLWQTRHAKNDRLPFMHLSLICLSLFFSFLAVFFDDAQPFREFVPAAAVGRGLNPLLQHWAMIIHPPLLYIGYVSFAIPFTIAMSAMITDSISIQWLKFVRKWAIFSWFFLGIGILLGSKWAYEELGWGGYWAWDPVENASLMPWLLGSAFIHSIIIEERRGMLKFWNMFLIILTFHFTLLGTWITRSGVLEGPHSFSRSSTGIPFIGYIIISFLVYSMILIWRRDRLQPERNLEAITSKEGSFFLNNFILVMGSLVILLGVFSPLLYGKEFKSPWYNSWGVPAGIFLLLLMGASPLLAWRKGVAQVFLVSMWVPLLAGVIGGGIFLAIYPGIFTKSAYSVSDVSGEIYSVVTIALAVFTLTGIIQEYHKGIASRRTEHPGENYFLAGWRMLLKNKRRYGGYLVHFSMVLLFVGYAGNAFKQNTSIKFFYNMVQSASDEIIYSSPDKGVLGNYEIEADGLIIKPLINGDPKIRPNIFNVIVSEEASYNVRRHLKPFERMVTERRFYPQISHLTGDFETHVPTSEPSIASTPKEDLYIQLGAIELPGSREENPELPMMYMNYYFNSKSLMDKAKNIERFPTQIVANLEIWINPLVKFIWYGSLLFFFSGLMILLPIGEKK